MCKTSHSCKACGCQEEICNFKSTSRAGIFAQEIEESLTGRGDGAAAIADQVEAAVQDEAFDLEGLEAAGSNSAATAMLERMETAKPTLLSPALKHGLTFW